MIVVGTIAVVAITIALGIVADRKWGLLPRPERLGEVKVRPTRPPPAGETAATAIRAGAEQLANLRAQRCRACRAVLEPAEDDHVRYDDRELIVLQFRCPRCAAKRSLYVDPVA